MTEEEEEDTFSNYLPIKSDGVVDGDTTNHGNPSLDAQGCLQDAVAALDILQGRLCVYV